MAHRTWPTVGEWFYSHATLVLHHQIDPDLVFAMTIGEEESGDEKRSCARITTHEARVPAA